ncbi:SRPBCC family protein [Kitasatospora sp. NPDC058162]|uniref:SRPBCC family protein n=1 Tax=Kitasatospora sp. NPDC058162 TaxID=3346362 RepID=UPI0036DABC5D
MWEYEHSLVADVTPEAVWALYRDPESWLRWDHGLAAIALHGPFEVGTKGVLTPKGQDELPFTLTEVEPDRRFADETAVNGLVLHFIHTLEPQEDGRTRITHRVEITGPAAPDLAPHVGPAVTAGIPATLTRLADLAAAA